MDNDRLIDTSDLPLEREILRAAANETAPTDVRRRTLASLGLLVIAPTAAAAYVGASASATTSATGGAVGKSIWWQVWLPKVGLLLGLGGTAIGGAVAWERGQVNAHTVSAGAPAARDVGKIMPAVAELSRLPEVGTSASMPGAPTAVSSPAALPLGTQPAPTPVSPETSGTAPARRPSASASRESTALTPTSAEGKGAASIRDEIDRLDRARAELRRGAPDAAMAILREYFARYPSGELSAEAELVRREAQRARE